MKKLTRPVLVAGLILLTAWSAFSQETLTSDAIREKIKQLKAIAVEGRSASIHNSALLGWYTQLQSALERERDRLQKIQALTAPSDTKTLEDITNELNRIDSEMTGITSIVATMRNASPPVPGAQLPGASTDVGSTTNTGTSNVPNSPGSQPANPNTATGSAGAGTSGAPQASTNPNLNDDLNARIQEAVRARIQQRENTKQAETPAATTNSTSLVDTSSAGDLVNVGLAIAGLTGDDDGANSTNSVSVTASAYAFFAAAKNMDPLNPGFYNRHSGWRRLSFTLGYDDEKLKDGTTEKAPIFGFKYLFVDKRDPSLRRHDKDFATIGAHLQKASVAFGNLSSAVDFSFAKSTIVRQKFLIPQFRVFLKEKLKNLGPNAVDDRARITTLLEVDLDKGDVFVLGEDGMPPLAGQPGQWTREENHFYQFNFQNEYLVADYRNKLKEAFGQKVLDDLDAFIATQLADTGAFEDLTDTTREALERIRRAPQFAFSFLTKQRSETSDEYHAETIFDYGVANRVNLTLNGSFLYRDSPLVGGDTRGGKFAGQFRFQLTPEQLAGRNPFYFFLSGNAETLSGRKPLYQAQAKLMIPILNGMDLPLALTYSNRNEFEFDKKHKTRVQFGFAIDTARILQALTSK